MARIDARRVGSNHIVELPKAKPDEVDQSNLEYHEKASGTFNEVLSKGSAPPPHAH